jgi:amino acid adenylation domain-containing protein
VNISALINELEALHVVLSLDGEKLRVSAPKGALSDELRARIIAQRDVLTELLRNSQESKRAADSIAPASTRGPSPLTPAQHQLWFLDRLTPGSAFLNIPLVARVRGDLDVEALAQAVTELGRRHDSLVSRIVELRDVPHQTPSGVELSLRQEDYSELPPSERESAVSARIDREIVRPFDLGDTEPLARFLLLKKTPAEHLLLVVVNHVVLDGPSQRVLLEDLRKLYEARVQNRATPSAPRLCFADFARWQRQTRERATRTADLDFWKQRLAGMPLSIELPIDRPPGARRTHRSHHAYATLDPRLSQGLRRVARDHGATVNMLALASIQLLLYRYSGQDDFGVGLPVQNRGHEAFEEQIGMFLNTVVMRSEIPKSSTFSELLMRIRDSQIDALSHGNVAFEELVPFLSPNRTQTQQSPLLQVYYSYQDDGESRFSMADVEVEIESKFTGYSMTDLTFWTHDRGENLWLAAEGAADLFERETAERLFRSWRRLLEAVVENPDARLADMPIMSAEDEHHLLFELNETAKPWDRDALIHRLFEAVVDRKPDSVALAFEEQEVSFRELDRRANRLAHWLVRRGVGPDSRVGISVHKGIEQVVAMLAILKASGAYVGLDPSYPDARLSALLADSEARILISESDIAPRIDTKAELFLVDRDTASLEQESAERLSSVDRPDQLAYIIYTSGSSGTPKGVMVEHRNVTSFFAAMQHAIGLDDTGAWIAGASISFDMSVIEILGSLCYGRQVVMLGDSVLGEVQDARYAIPALIQRHGVTHLQCTPSQAQMLISEPAGRAAVASLKQLLCGGEPIPEELAVELCELVRGEVVNIYGPTETTVYATLGPMEKGGRAIGRPIPNTCVFILDANGRLVPKGAPGELCIGSPGVTRGYLKRPELTAERFIDNTLRPEISAKLYRSGDLVRYAADGTILYVGRNDQQVKIRGYRIELGEIEARIRELTGVRDAAVMARGTGNQKRLVGYVVTGPDYVGDDALREALRVKLPDFMVPRAFVHLSALPLNHNGKLDRGALPEPSQDDSPSLSHVSPRDERERELCEIWQRALGQKHVGVTDNFFDLGGQSLMAVKISNEVERTFGLRLPLATLFECPTVEQFAKRLSELGGRASQSASPAFTTLVPVRPRGSLPPLFCVAGAGGNPMNLRHVAAELGDDQPFYGLQYRGVDGQLPPHRRIRDMAEEFLRDVRSVQPRGPYYLSGYSAGGLAAYEMAQLLQKAGESVGLVIFFDTMNPRLPRWGIAERALGHLENFRRDGLSYLPDRILARLREEWTSGLRRVRAELAKRDPFTYRHEAVWEAGEEAIRHYDPEPYYGDVLLLRADPSLSQAGGIGVRPHESNGWRELVRGNFSLIELPVSHRDIVSDSSARLASRALCEALARARQRPQPGPSLRVA